MGHETVVKIQSTGIDWEFGTDMHVLQYLRHLKIDMLGTSLVVQWLTVHLLMQGTWVQFLVQEDSTCHRANKPMSHNY